MQVCELAKFFRAVGHRVIQTNDSFWYDSRPFILKRLLSYQTIAPRPGELTKILMKGPAFALRYAELPDGTCANGGSYICSDPNYDFGSLSSNARSHTRRGLARCNVEKIDFRYLARHAHTLIEDLCARKSAIRQGNRSQWKRYCERAGHQRDIEAWGAFVGDSLAAFTVTFLVEDCLELHIGSSAPRFLRCYPNNALLFTVVKSKLGCPEVRRVFFGTKTLAARSGLDHFKTSMGFEIRPFKECVVINPLFSRISMAGTQLVNRIARHYPQNLFWQTASKALSLASLNQGPGSDYATLHNGESLATLRVVNHANPKDSESLQRRTKTVLHPR
jgi:hypothetical protein